MIRLILVCIFLLIIFVLSLILFPIEWLIGRISPKAKDISSLRFVQFVFKVILFLSGVSTTVIGLENIPKDEPVVFIGNHRGFFDTVVSYSRMPRLTGFIAKKEMQKVPFIRLWMKYLHCLFMDRSNPREGLKTILSGIEQINNGISIVIFPEGTRNKGDGIMPFHGGSFKLADKSNARRQQGGRSDQPPDEVQRIFAIDLASWSSRTGFASSNFRLTLFAFETTRVWYLCWLPVSVLV